MSGNRPSEGAGADCLVVGGGLSGLACAELLATRGRTVQVLEADGVGGRARTIMYQGEPVDRGFQALFRAYPETRDLCESIGIGRSELRSFERGIVVHDGATWRHVRPIRAGLLGSSVIGRADAARLAAIAARAAATPDRVLLEPAAGEETAQEYLTRHSVSAAAIDAIVRPLFGGILLDRSLAADAGYLAVPARDDDARRGGASRRRARNDRDTRRDGDHRGPAG